LSAELTKTHSFRLFFIPLGRLLNTPTTLNNNVSALIATKLSPHSGKLILQTELLFISS